MEAGYFLHFTEEEVRPLAGRWGNSPFALLEEGSTPGGVN
jgi:hypothetical protein